MTSQLDSVRIEARKGVAVACFPSISPEAKSIILQDHEFIKQTVPSAAILTLTTAFITVVIMRTPYSRIQLRILYVEKYPHEAVIAELSSPTLPAPLLRNKEKECTDIAEGLIGKPQVEAVYNHIYQFIHTNMFIPCWKEMKQIVAICQGKGQLGCDENEGAIQMRLASGNYKQAIKLTVPNNYPVDGVRIQFEFSNFPNAVQTIFYSQAEEVVRRCEAGFSAEQALLQSNPIKMPVKIIGEVNAKITVDNIKNLKHDVSVLKQMSDLRDASAAKDKSKYFTHAKAERKEARKDLRRLAKAESDADQAQLAAMVADEENKMIQLMSANVSDSAQPSLVPVAKFLVEEYALRIPQEPCQACKKPILPADSSDEAACKVNSKRRPMRTFCGHWLHHNCLDKWLTNPPFLRYCPACERRIWHPDWSEDHKQLEKAWQQKEAKKREMSDVSINQCCKKSLFRSINSYGNIFGRYRTSWVWTVSSQLRRQGKAISEHSCRPIRSFK